MGNHRARDRIFGQLMDRLAELTRSRIPYPGEYYDRLNYENDADGGYRLVPNQTLPHVTVNGWGYRGRAFTGTERVLLLGDSVTFGIGAENDANVFSRFFERAAGVTVADASVRAYRIEQHLRRLPDLLARLPGIECVVLWGGFADLLYWVTSGGKTDGMFKFNETYARRSAWENKLRSILSPKRFKALWRRSAADHSNVEPLQTLSDKVADAILNIEALCSDRRIKFIFLLQPFVRQSAWTDPALAEIAAECDKKAVLKCGVSWCGAAVDFVRQLQRRLAGKLRYGFVDCQNFVTEFDFFDQVHLTSAALKKIAETVATSDLWATVCMPTQELRKGVI